MDVTVFQALLLLNKHHPEVADKVSLDELRRFALQGITSSEDEKRLDEILYKTADVRRLFKRLGVSAIKKDPIAINDDRVRRFFEATLAHETLKVTLDTIDVSKLEAFYRAGMASLSKEKQRFIEENIFGGLPPEENLEARKDITNMEYIDGYEQLCDPKSFKSLGEGVSKKQLAERKEIMKAILKVAFLSNEIVKGQELPIPADLYFKKGYVYSIEHRGRVPRTTYLPDEVARAKGSSDERAQQQVASSHLGIMRSYHPLPKDSHLTTNKPAKTVRCPDRSDFLASATLPNMEFATLVSPFVNSISGTVFTFLRLSGYLNMLGTNPYASDPKAYTTLVKSTIAFHGFLAGGHSLTEFMMPIQLPEIQALFKSHELFRPDIQLEHLFIHREPEALDKAIGMAIEYMTHDLGRDLVHKELRKKKGTSIEADRIGTRGRVIDKTKAPDKSKKSPPLYAFFKTFETLGAPERDVSAKQADAKAQAAGAPVSSMRGRGTSLKEEDEKEHHVDAQKEEIIQEQEVKKDSGPGKAS